MSSRTQGDMSPTRQAMSEPPNESAALAACELPKMMCCVTFTLYVASRREACRLTARRLGGKGGEGGGWGIGRPGPHLGQPQGTCLPNIFYMPF